MALSGGGLIPRDPDRNPTMLTAARPPDRTAFTAIVLLPAAIYPECRSSSHMLLSDRGQGRETIMAFNLLTTAAIGIGVYILAPLAGQILRPLAKTVIKGGVMA